mmetsp:Transcript_163520/g.397409  ORF Transcript_163520/g.397409 Transcript_163520/m.397409 type:complete len:310 (-) Transcript_163520:637-1566(-)
MQRLGTPHQVDVRARSVEAACPAWPPASRKAMATSSGVAVGKRSWSRSQRGRHSSSSGRRPPPPPPACGGGPGSASAMVRLPGLRSPLIVGLAMGRPAAPLSERESRRWASASSAPEFLERRLAPVELLLLWLRAFRSPSDVALPSDGSWTGSKDTWPFLSRRGSQPLGVRIHCSRTWISSPFWTMLSARSPYSGLLLYVTPWPATHRSTAPAARAEGDLSSCRFLPLLLPSAGGSSRSSAAALCRASPVGLPSGARRDGRFSDAVGLARACRRSPWPPSSGTCRRWLARSRCCGEAAGRGGGDSSSSS